ncbi:MAG: DUF4832 domain-containing protein [Lachnospiraceae bacterium]|nr:DUF4832 domain-containing protein [Lachnospiraceae bacterium]
MNKNFRRGTALTMAMVMAVLGTFSNLKNKEDIRAASNQIEHNVPKGTSSVANPLKGMFGYSEEDNFSFPHSMEWFYIPVSAVQTGMNTFNWTALEKKLNDVASRGHQSVFRFYYDYPGEGNGVPQFVKDQGLTMRYYNEPNDLGGSGYCPDYENAYFRQSMQSFISEFGKQYDGDGRIGFLTIGLLGFWGEWHNWPYDEDTSDGKPDWSISTTVYREVLDAFDNAFNKTKICVREPKDGINFGNYNVGYHDDSFGYATLSQANGGQDWSFMQKLKNAKVQDKWKTECIGGEIYPPSQNQIFSGQPGDYQDWNKCLNEAHATWMLNENIKYYSGTSYTRAVEAAKQLGYDLQVDKAYYSDVVNEGEEIPFTVKIANIGTAPFYYGHDVWPVRVGIKSGTSLNVVGDTNWDLNTIAAGESKSFSYSLPSTLSEGTYDICIKVVNPIENGVNFSFANLNQDSNGWLTIGSVQVKKNEVEETTTEIVTEQATEKNTEIVTDNPYEGTKQWGQVTVSDGMAVWCDDQYIYFNLTNYNPDGNDNYQYFIDSDNNSNTGYREFGGGFEYLLENDKLYRYAGSNNEWKFDNIGDCQVVGTIGQYGDVVWFEKDFIDFSSNGARALYRILDQNWNCISDSGMIPVQMKTGSFPKVTNELNIKGLQLSFRGNGIRTLYTLKEYIDGKKVEEFGLVYGLDIDPLLNGEELVVGSNSKWVKAFAGTEEKGRRRDLENGTDGLKCYAMTMTYAIGNAAELSDYYTSRVYAKLSDGSYVYSSAFRYSPYVLAESLLRLGVESQENTDYLLNKIVRVVNPDYVYEPVSYPEIPIIYE